MLKKITDFSMALLFLLLFWWLFILCWIMVKLSSPGPGIFVQERVGKFGKPFYCYKFRTMFINTKQAATNEVSADAITDLGRIFRKTRLDEIPQIFNILKGEMSFVGPRPCLLTQEELIKERTARHVHRLIPGITGLSQIAGIDMSDPKKLAIKDAEYLEKQSYLLDIKIIFKTLFHSHNEYHSKT